MADAESEKFDAKLRKVDGFLNRMSDAQFRAPAFQRPFVWTSAEIMQLLDDARSAKDAKNEYFIGSIVRTKVSADEAFMVVDGQQRLTVTMILLLYAAALTNDKARRKRLLKLATFDSGESVRWTPTNLDTGQMAAVLADIDLLAEERGGAPLKVGLPSDVEASAEQVGPLRDCLAVINSELGNAPSRRESTVDGLLEKCVMVDLVVPAGTDPTQVFASINGTGKGLAAADLIRNFVFQKVGWTHKDAENFMKDHWTAIDRPLNFFRLQDQFYLTLASSFNHEATRETVFRVLSDRWATWKPERIAKEISQNLKIFLALAVTEKGWQRYRQAFDEKNFDTRLDEERRFKSVGEAMERIREVPGVAASWIYLLPLLRGVEKNSQTAWNDAAKCVRLVESLFIRRLLVDRQDSIRYFFKPLYKKRILTSSQLKKEIFSARNGDVRGPSDADIRKHLLEKDVYASSITKGAKYVLETQERHADGAERPCDFEKLRSNYRDVDHILPRNCSAKRLTEWGVTSEQHERWVNNIGNLMLTDASMNRSKSDRGWNEPAKKNGVSPRELYLGAHYYVLPKALANKNVTWNPEKIKRRTNQVVDFIVSPNKGWPSFE